MRVNEEVNTKWRDMTGEIHIPETSHCPNQIKKICENILTMCLRLGGTCPTNYNTMTELDKTLMVEYWKEYDGLTLDLEMEPAIVWFIKHATEPDAIRRARQYLVEHHAIYVKPEVKERADHASDNMRHSVKR